jgi:hypothetical protein
MRYQWYFDADELIHFCIIGNMVAQVRPAATTPVTFESRIFASFGDHPIDLITQGGWSTAEYAQEWSEAALRDFASSQQREVFALSQIAHLAEKSWQVLILESMNRMEFFLDIPAVGFIQVLKGARWTWVVQCPHYQQGNASGVADTLTHAKVDAVAALVKLYLQHTIRTDGNTELMRLQKVQSV